ncbi:podoplanin isoform X8 [Falco biarmicus]|uniref:podoplanin isoform X8 n=1 Tax=Falco cherrug TaxID=345164 RepID=UPI00247AC77E|nr:podoplanin isoform X8 [Falco cherrug]XP_055654702.1 podoplanin isoform X8 [Falco peregrinus]XP_056186632.1 podoplanin isoform X8 [Falco biarmicus]
MFIKVQFFIIVLGSVPFLALAEEASSVLEGEESATIDFRERNDTEYEELPTLFGQLMTTESAFATAEESVNSTGYEVNTEDVDGGLETIALVGIIIGIIVAVGILAGIIIAVVRKMSGRYSP